MPKTKKNIKVRDQRPKEDPKGGRRRLRLQGGETRTNRPTRRPLQ